MSSESLGDSMAENRGTAQTRAKNKYNAKKYDSLRIVVQKGARAVISDYAASQGKSTNGLVNELLESEIPALKDIKNNKPSLK